MTLSLSCVVILQIRMRTECILPGQVELESSLEAESESVVVQAVHSSAGGGEEHRRFAALLTV